MHPRSGQRIWPGWPWGSGEHWRRSSSYPDRASGSSRVYRRWTEKSCMPAGKRLLPAPCSGPERLSKVLTIFVSPEEGIVTVTPSKTVQITVDAGMWLGELAHNWNYIGYD